MQTEKCAEIYWCGVRENPRRKVKRLFSICMDVDLVSHSTAQLRARKKEQEEENARHSIPN